ncbi:MAG: hypothetical protein Q9180_009290, partial [Flavoplaca navasiana]
AAAKEQIPDELRFGFKDEMGKAKSLDKGKGKEHPSADGGNDDNVADQKGSSESSGRELIDTGRTLEPLSPPPAPTMAPAQPLRHQMPTRTTPVPPSTPENGVPPWVDKAIVGVIAGLLVMLVKKIVI